MTVLNWIEGRGWLVFSGGESPGSPLRAQALTRAKPQGGVAYISLADDRGDALLADMDDLGAPYGYMIDIEHEDDDAIIEQLNEASVIVVETGDSLNELASLLPGAAQTGMRQAYERGAVILVEGLAANLFGHIVVTDGGELIEGMDWVKNALIEPAAHGIEDSRAVQLALNENDEAIAISIAGGSALALGPAGQIELWGEQQVTISLGRAYTDEA